MLPFYHPTTTLLIEDDQAFLESWSFRFEHSFICETSARPEQAIEQVRERSRPLLKTHDLVHTNIVIPDSAPGEVALQICAANIASIPLIAHRFAMVSVLIVDYAMPGMNGIDVCKALNDVPVRKILLTGKATQDIAVTAFNDRLIDRFLVKQDPDLSRRLKAEVSALQRDYFWELAGPVGALLHSDDTAFLRDRGFAAWFDQFCSSKGVVEHYVTVNPTGVIVVDQAGSRTVVHVHSVERQRSQMESAHDDEAPAALLERLAAAEAISWFPTPYGYYEPRFAKNWENFVFPATAVSPNFVVAVRPQIEGEEQAVPLSYTAYRSQAGR